MAADLETVLEAELVRLGRRGGMDRGLGAKLTAQRLRTDHFEATLEAQASVEAVTSWVVAALGILGLVAFALLSARVRAFWDRVRQGFTVLRDRRRYLREVWLVQLGGWALRFAAFWLLLEAFSVGGSVENVLLVLGVNAVAALVPFTPGGAGVQQALLVKVFAGSAAGATVAAYSVGQQIAIAATTFACGFAALVFIFRFRSFKEVIAAGREARRASPESATS